MSHAEDLTSKNIYTHTQLYVLFIIYSAVTWIGPGTSLFQAQPLATWVEPQVSHCCIWDLMDHKAALLIGVKYSIMQQTR